MALDNTPLQGPVLHLWRGARQRSTGAILHGHTRATMWHVREGGKVTFNDLRWQLMAYNRLPNTLEARLNAAPPPPLSCYCRVCGVHYKDFPLSWDDIARELELGRGDDAYKVLGLCSKHDDYEEDNDDEAD